MNRHQSVDAEHANIKQIGAGFRDGSASKKSALFTNGQIVIPDLRSK